MSLTNAEGLQKQQLNTADNQTSSLLCLDLVVLVFTQIQLHTLILSTVFCVHLKKTNS